MAKFAITHPIPLFIVSNLISTATGAFTQKNSAFRYLGFLACVGITILAFENFSAHVQTTGWAGRCLAGTVFTSPHVLFDRLIHRKWAYGQDYLGPATTPAAEREKQSRWEFGSQVAGSMRCVGSEMEVANVPYFDDTDHAYVPSRIGFLARHVCLAVALCYLNTFMIDIQMSVDPVLLGDVYLPFFTRLADVSLDEVITRFKVSITYWVAQYCFLQLMYSVCATVGVSFSPGGLKFWRPQFGSIASSYTMRNFWGKFWHQNIQLNVKGPADFIAHTVLHLPPGTIVTRYTKILLAFAASGAMHIFADTGGALTMMESGAMRFFCSQALGIALEDGVQALYRKISGNKDSGTFGRIVGYVWVVAFLSWSSPCWVYPVLRTMERGDAMLNLAAMRPLIENLW